MAKNGTVRDAARFLESAGRGLGKLPQWGLERALETARQIVDPNAKSSETGAAAGPVQRMTETALRRSTDTARISSSPSAAAATLAEMRNKAEVYFLVRGNRHMLGIPSPYPDPFPLSFYLERAYGHEDYPALFLVEGLGRHFGRSKWRPGSSLSALLHEASHLPLSTKSLFMLHAGLGMAFAKDLLDDLPARESRSELEDAIHRFVTLCKANSRPGYQIASLEPLGLVTRTFHPRRTQAVDQILAEHYPKLRALYWHGAGRALYFLPQHALPCATWEGFLQCRRDAVDTLSEEQLSAGHAWAFTLVNLRHPEVLLNLFIKLHGHEHPHPAAFRRGVAAALVMRADTTPGAPMIDEFLRFDAISADSRSLWDDLIRTPAHTALGELAAGSSAAAWMNQTFGYQES